MAGEEKEKQYTDIGGERMRYDYIEEVEKFNPYHDARGRFTSANSATSFTIRTRAGYNQGMANRSIERAKENYKATQSTKKPKTKKPKEKKPKLSRKESAAQKTREFIKNQTNVDIDKYRSDTTRHYDNTKITHVNWKDMPKTERRQLELLQSRYGGSIILHDSGAWMKGIERVKKS